MPMRLICGDNFFENFISKVLCCNLGFYLCHRLADIFSPFYVASSLILAYCYQPFASSFKFFCPKNLANLSPTTNSFERGL